MLEPLGHCFRSKNGKAFKAKESQKTCQDGLFVAFGTKGEELNTSVSLFHGRYLRYPISYLM
jgi:hypothetical protein